MRKKSEPAQAEEKCFSAADLHKYDAAQARVEVGLLSIQLKKLTHDNLRLQYELQSRKLLDELTATTAEAKRAEARLLEVQQQLSKDYGVDLSRITYDDISGKITVLD